MFNSTDYYYGYISFTLSHTLQCVLGKQESRKAGGKKTLGERWLYIKPFSTSYQDQIILSSVLWKKKISLCKRSFPLSPPGPKSTTPEKKTPITSFKFFTRQSYKPHPTPLPTSPPQPSYLKTLSSLHSHTGTLREQKRLDKL